MDFNSYVEERMDGVYKLLSESSVIMERTNKNDKTFIKMQRKEFIQYLKNQHPDFDPNEIKYVKSEKERDKVIKKYENDFKKWKRKNMFIDIGLDLAGFIFI